MIKEHSEKIVQNNAPVVVTADVTDLTEPVILQVNALQDGKDRNVIKVKTLIEAKH